MDFNDTPEEAAFRAEARAWLEPTPAQERRQAELPGAQRRSRAAEEGQGLAGEESRRRLRRHHLAEGVSAAAAARPIYQVIFKQEEAKFQAPPGFSTSASACASRP